MMLLSISFVRATGLYTCNITACSVPFVCILFAKVETKRCNKYFCWRTYCLSTSKIHFTSVGRQELHRSWICICSWISMFSHLGLRCKWQFLFLLVQCSFCFKAFENCQLHISLLPSQRHALLLSCTVTHIFSNMKETLKTCYTAGKWKLNSTCLFTHWFTLILKYNFFLCIPGPRRVSTLFSVICYVPTSLLCWIVSLCLLTI